MNAKIKTIVIIISSGIIVLGLILFFTLNGDEKRENAISDYKSAQKSEEQIIRDANYYMNSSKETERASTGSLITQDQPEPVSMIINKDISEYTDDPDIAVLEETQDRLRNSATLREQQEKERVLKNNSNPQNAKETNEIIGLKVDKIPEEPISSIVSQTRIEQPDELVIVQRQNEDISQNRFSKTITGKSKANTYSIFTLREQTVKDGSVLRLITQEPIKLDNGFMIPSKTVLSGKVAFNGDRISVVISETIINESIVSVNKSVYDTDGLPGIATNVNLQNIQQEKEFADLATSSIPTGGGIVGTGVNAASNAVRTIFNKKSGSYEVTIRANYKLYIR